MLIAKVFSQKIKNTAKYLQSLFTFSYSFFFWVFSKVIGWFIKLWRLIFDVKWLAENNNKN